MTSDPYVSTRALHAAINGREPETPEALAPPGVTAGLGARRWHWWFEVVE
jgi:hypothetical protein